MTDSFQWERGDVPAGPFVDIGGATSIDYLQDAGDVGKYLRARGYRDAVLVGESNVKGPIADVISPVPSSDIWWSGPTPPSTDYSGLTPNRADITTVTDLKNLLKAGGTLAPGDVVVVRSGASGAGYVPFAIRLPDYADVIFDGWEWEATPSSNPAVQVSSKKLRCYGGVVSSLDGGNETAHNGGDAIKIVNYPAGAPTDFRWWGFKVDGAAAQGISAQCNNSQIVVDLQGEITNWGTKYLTLDPHTYEKGTGLHGAYLGGGAVVAGTTQCSGRAILYAHDAYPGAGWSCGANMQDFEVWLSERNLTWTHDRLAGAGFQQWGNNNRNITVKNLLVDGAQMATFFESLSSGPVRIEYGRYKNIRLTPAFQTNTHVTYGDFAAA